MSQWRPFLICMIFLLNVPSAQAALLDCRALLERVRNLIPGAAPEKASTLTKEIEWANAPFKKPASPLVVAQVPLSLQLTTPATLTTPADVSNASTKELQAYLNELYGEGILSAEDLRRFREQFILTGKLLNPFVGKNLAAIHLLHQENLDSILSNEEIQHSHIVYWVEGLLRQNLTEQVQKQASTALTSQTFKEIHFNVVHPPRASFEFKLRNETYSASLTHSFAIMDAPVTQYQWAQLMKHNPSRLGFNHRPSTEETSITINGRTVRMSPDHPVNNLTWWSALEFANRLSIAHGLTPAYDLSHVEMQPGTSADSGDWTNVLKDYLEHQTYPIYDVKINAPDGDVYRAEGYRLPTVTEQSFILREKGYELAHDRITDPVERFDHWAAINFQEQMLYPLFQNVGEWAWDALFPRKNIYKRGRNPVFDDREYVHREPGVTFQGSSKIGFRLVRTLK